MKKFVLVSGLIVPLLPLMILEASAANVVKPIHYPTYTLRCSVMLNGGRPYFVVQNRVVSSIPKGHKIEITYRNARHSARSQSTTVIAHSDVPRYRMITFAGINGARSCGATVKMHPIAAAL